MQANIELPLITGETAVYWPTEGKYKVPEGGPFKSRIAFAAAHVVANPLGDRTDGIAADSIDWEGTLAYRRHLWSHGFAVAEAMDTSQRGMGLDWPSALELMTRSVAEAHTLGAKVFCGAGTDHMPAGRHYQLDDVIAAYQLQFAAIEKMGGRIIMMASRALTACARSAEDYANVYAKILGESSQPVILHWLGEVFDPQLAGYWGSANLDTAMDTAIAVIRTNSAKIEGIKISLLNADYEVEMRRRLPPNVHMYTGDDFNYPALIKGDGIGYSHALLGIFDAIAPVAAAAFHALDRGDVATYDEIFEPTVALSRHLFQSPTYYYKTGITFLAYINGYQNHFKMIGGQEQARTKVHLATAFMLADKCGLIRDPDLAIDRMRLYLST